jgi:hypothetical protein
MFCCVDLSVCINTLMTKCVASSFIFEELYKRFYFLLCFSETGEDTHKVSEQSVGSSQHWFVLTDQALVARNASTYMRSAESFGQFKRSAYAFRTGICAWGGVQR